MPLLCIEQVARCHDGYVIHQQGLP